MTQRVQISRRNDNTPPPARLSGVLSAELGAYTKLWIGSPSGNRLLLSSEPGEPDVVAPTYAVAIVGATPPVGVAPGSLWFDSASSQLFALYQDPNSTAWVALSTGIALGSSPGTAADFPAAPSVGQVYALPNGLRWSWDGVKWVAAPPATAPAQTPVPVTGSTVLAPGFVGLILVANNTGGPVTITLPLSPVTGQRLTVKDILGNAGSYPITVAGNGVLIEGAPSLVLAYAYSWVDLVFAGSQWVQV